MNTTPFRLVIACGHNLISETGLTAALALKDALKTTPGKLVVIGTPAEEMDGAKPYLLKAGYMNGIDVIFANHGGAGWCTEVEYKSIVGPTYDNMLIFRGQIFPCFCSSMGKEEALWTAAMLMGIGFEFLREHMPETDRVQYVFVKAGEASNVVPDFAQVEFNIRADSTTELAELQKRVG